MDKAKLKDLCEKATKGPWTGHRMVNEETGEPMSPEDVGEYVKNSILKSFKQSGNMDFLFVSCTKEDGDYDICHVGNGPTSPHNNAFIVASRTALPALLEENKGLETALAHERERTARLFAEVERLTGLLEGK